MKQIIAMGGGGFSMEPENLLLDKYILKQASKSKPKVCFIPTASGDAEGYIERFYESFHKLDSIPSHLSLFKPPTKDLEDFILDKDVIYVGGGNTRNLLVLWKEWGLDNILKKSWNEGVVLSGLSAGSICWFEEGLTDSNPGKLSKLECLGFLKGSNSPHYDGEADRKPAYHHLIRTGELSDGYAADDGVAIHFIDHELYRVVSSRPKAKSYRVYRELDKVREIPLETIYLENSDLI